MTPAQADKLIRNERAVMVRNTVYDEIFIATFSRRDRYNIYTADGGVFDRADLEVVQDWNKVHK